MKNLFNKYILSFLFLGILASSCNAQNKAKEIESLRGYTIGYDPNTGCGCFYVDKDMIAAGVATDIKDKANKSCTSAKYGMGAPISFKDIPADADYTIPSENTLMIATGYWEMKGGKNTFFANHIEPFF